MMQKIDEKIKVASEYGIINRWFYCDSILQISTVLEKFVVRDANQLEVIPMITASKLYVRVINGKTGSCEGGC